MKLGMIAMIMGGLPVWAANRGIVLGQPSDRYSTPLMLGACLLLAAVIRGLESDTNKGIVLVSLLVGFSTSFQFRTQERYAHDWSRQKELFQQLSWRAPSLEKGTAILLVDDSEIAPKSDYALSVPVNMIYQSHASAAFSYWIFHVSPTGRDGMLPPADKAPLDATARTLSFHGNSDAALVAWLPRDGCLKLMSGVLPSPYTSPLAQLLAPLSRLERIGAADAQHALPGFKPPTHASWCYYYERGELARQLGQWRLAASLGDQARKLNLRPDDPAEWLPFIEAYLRQSRYLDAVTLTTHVSRWLPPQWNPLSIATHLSADSWIPHSNVQATKP
jgi:hypothetical protein